MHFYQFNEWEFYDLESDPDERINQFENPEYAAQISELKTELKRLQDFYGDNSDMSEKPPEWQKKHREDRLKSRQKK